MGTLGDRIGRRRLLLIGAAAFGVASVLAAFATSPRMLIAMRAVPGVAGATLAPSTLSLIRNMFHDPRQRTLAIGVWITSYSAGAAIGPPLGGILLQQFWWGSVFLVGVPVMLLLLIGPVLLPEFRNPHAGRPDLPSVALSLAGVLPVIFGLKRVAADGLERLLVLSIAAGVVVALAFLRRQTKLADPLIDLRLFRAPAFSASLATYMAGTFVAFGCFYFIAQYLQLVLGMDPLAAGLWTVPFAAAFIVSSLATPLIVRRRRPAYLMAAGLRLAAVGFAALTRIGVAEGPAALVAAFVIYSLGLAPVFTLATDLVVGSAPPERAGAAAAISETSSEFGGALGIAALGSIGTAVYRNAMGAADLTALSPAAAGGLPYPFRGEVLGAARDAFAPVAGAGRRHQRVDPGGRRRDDHRPAATRGHGRSRLRPLRGSGPPPSPRAAPAASRPRVPATARPR